MRDPTLFHPDAPHAGKARLAWHDAFAALPAETPPADGWARVAAAIDPPRGAMPARARRRTRVAGGLALAATLALAVALPWHATRDDPAPPPAVATGTAAPSTLDALYAESARLEALLAHARDSRMASGPAMAMAADLEARVAAVDAALAQPGLAHARREALWTERVEALQALASFEGTRRWLAAHGTQYDGALVQVN